MESYLTLYTKINSKWIKNLNLTAKTTQFLEQNRREKPHDNRFSDDFFYITTKARQRKNRQTRLQKY